VGTLVFLQHGWRAGAGLSVGLAGCMIAILLVRGPHTKRYTWFGYEGGTAWRKEVPKEKKTTIPEESKQASGARSETTKSDEVVEVTSTSGDETMRSQQLGRSMA
jgi:hypothetical protein